MSNSRAIKVCGLGAVPREDATLEALQALRSCRAVYSDLADPEAFAWLKGFCALRRADGAAEILEAAGSSGLVGVAVWGHPLVNSPLAREVLAGGRKAGIPCEILGGVSPIGAVLAKETAFFGGEEGCQGAQAYALETLLEEPGLLESPLPLIVFSEKAGPWSRLAQELLRHFPGRHPLRLYALPAFQERRMTLEEFGAIELSGSVLVVPPGGKHGR